MVQKFYFYSNICTHIHVGCGCVSALFIQHVRLGDSTDIDVLGPIKEVDHWKAEGNSTSTPPGKHQFHLTSILWIGEIKSLAQGHSVDG